MQKVVIDIETIRNGNLPDEVKDFREAHIRASANTKDPEKIAAQIAEKKAALYEKDALDPDYGMICCVGIWMPELWGTPLSTTATVNEKDLLETTFRILRSETVAGEPIELITFGGTKFDIPYIYHRCMMLGIKMPNPIYTTPHSDVAYMMEHTNWLPEGGMPQKKLALYALLNGIPYYEDADGHDVQMLWDAGRYDDIRKHCESDVRVTWELYKKAEPYIIPRPKYSY